MTVGVACCLIAVCFFGSIPVILRHLTAYLDSWTVNAVRYSTAALFWLPFVLLTHRRQRIRQPQGDGRRSIWVVTLIPTACNLVGQIGWAFCPYYVDAPTIGFVVRLSFLFTALFGFLLVPTERKLARHPLFYVGALVGLAGLTVMYVDKLHQANAAAGGGLVGLAIVMGTAMFWGAYVVSVRKFLHGYPIRMAFGVVSLYTAAVLVVLMFCFGDYGQLRTLPAEVWGVLLASAFIGIAFAHILYYRGIHTIGPVVANGVMTAGPFWTYVLAMTFLNETMTGWQFLGGLGVVAGGLLLVTAKAQIQRRAAFATR